ncbi:hypothetical protein [Streptomyces atriruber]|uniref:hypothetical protein n=1 Tax=Streptomyces atriruber TaxID=545121 RepID=UPI0006E18BBA|nr:hypothetical protein [Streptomyces atriruber]
MTHRPISPDDQEKAGRAAASWELLRRGVTHPLTRMAAAALLQALAAHLGRSDTGTRPPAGDCRSAASGERSACLDTA